MNSALGAINGAYRGAYRAAPLLARFYVEAYGNLAS
jgi:hypothetical protein